MEGLRIKYQKIRKNIKSGDGKTLIGNFFSLSFLQIAGYIFPLITLPYLAKVLGVYYFGAIAFANTIIVYFQTLVDYGFIYSSVRDISKCRDDKEKVSYIFSTVMYARFFLTVAAFVLLCILILFIPIFREMSLVLVCTFMLIPGHALFADWFFQGVEKMVYIAIGNLVIKLLFTVLVFVFIKCPQDYFFQPLLTALGYVCAGIYSIYVIYKYGYRFVKVSFHIIWISIKSNTDLFINQLFSNLYNSLSVMLLGVFHGATANSVFEAGYRFSGTFQQFSNVIARTFFPFLSRKTEAHKIYAKYNLFVAIGLTVVLLITAPWIIGVFFNNDYQNAVYVLQILSLSVFFLTVSNVYGVSYLVIHGYEKEQRKATMYASIIGFIIGVPLVYFYSYIGAAIVISFVRGLIALFVYLAYLKINKNENFSGK